MAADAGLSPSVPMNDIIYIDLYEIDFTLILWECPGIILFINALCNK